MNQVLLLLLCFLVFGCNNPKSELKFKELRNISEQKPDAPNENEEPITYSLLVSTLIKPKCLGCHSADGENAGGINLETYENVVVQMTAIKAEVMSDRMPKSRIKLTTQEKKVLFTWIDAGGPKDPDEVLPVEKITYEAVHNKVILPRCIGCHSEEHGNVGDINLETYENVVAISSSIEEQIKTGKMPRPRTRPLTTEQKELILQWIAQGAPRAK